MPPVSPVELAIAAHAGGSPHLALPGVDFFAACDGTNLQRDHDRIERLTDSWSSRANVRKAGPDLTLDYDPNKPDFLSELLPFHDHPLYQKATEEEKQAALSCGWIAYNEKTVAIESKIVSPACMYLIDGEVSGFPRHRHRSAIAQALTDESFHILLVVQATGVTRRRRRLQELTLPAFDLVRSMQGHQEKHPEQWKKILIQLATSIVSEVMVSEYLSRLSNAANIQPLNRITTEIHRRDESAHNGLFKSLGAVIYHGLNAREREFFVGALSQPSIWFASPELDVWEVMLKQIGFPGAERMIADCRAQRRTKDIHLDLSTLENLFADLGVENTLWARAFTP
ncbi:MAG TPA: diiron oxygenase [Gemmataceae bacterium]|nr:diiron oxygenase [Gemmataceae bacterium]